MYKKSEVKTQIETKNILDNFIHTKGAKYSGKYQVNYSVKDIKELENLGATYMGDDISIELYEDKEDIHHYLRVIIDSEEWSLSAVPTSISYPSNTEHN